MNKFYETANVISVFFLMPIFIFLAANRIRNADNAPAQEAVMEQAPMAPLKMPIAPAKPEMGIAPEANVGVGVNVQKPMAIDSAPTPEKIQPRPNPNNRRARPGQRPQPGRPNCNGNSCMIPR